MTVLKDIGFTDYPIGTVFTDNNGDRYKVTTVDAGNEIIIAHQIDSEGNVDSGDKGEVFSSRGAWLCYVRDGDHADLVRRARDDSEFADPYDNSNTAHANPNDFHNRQSAERQGAANRVALKREERQPNPLYW